MNLLVAIAPTKCRKQSSSLFYIAALLSLLVLLPALVYGQTTDVWLGGTGNWSDSSKWSAGVPTATSNVFIDNGSGATSAVTVDLNALCGNLTIDSGDSLTIPGGTTLTVNGTSIINNGKINITANSSNAVLSIAAGRNVMISGGGTVNLIESGNQLTAIISGGSGSSLTNTSTIQGQGWIGNSGGLALINQAGGVINANTMQGELEVDPIKVTNRGLMDATNGGLLRLATTADNSGGTISSSGSFSIVLNYGVIQGGTVTSTNSGVMQNAQVMEATNGAVLTLSGITNIKIIKTLGSGSKVLVTGTIANYGVFNVGCRTQFQITGTLSNFGNETLQGGSYTVCGTLQFPGANIVNNAASIRLTGPSSAIVDSSNNDGLRNLSSTSKNGLFSLSSGRNLTTPGNYTNAGKLIIGPKTKFTVNGGYEETAGSIKVDGILDAHLGSAIQFGANAFGKGTVASTVTSSGSVTAGDTASKPAKLSLGTYAQGSIGNLNIAIGGANVGTQYGQLAVANGVILDGALNIKLINGFKPEIGNTFAILTASVATGQFAQVTGLSINGSEHFEITYNPTNVTLTVVSGP